MYECFPCSKGDFLKTKYTKVRFLELWIWVIKYFLSFCLIVILDPSLHRSRRVSPIDICSLKRETIQPADFIRAHVCADSLMREYIQKSICDGVSNCFHCNTNNVQLVGNQPITTASCDIIPELKHNIDRHTASHLCYGLARNGAWEMCVSQESFNLLHCPAVTLFLGK